MRNTTTLLVLCVSLFLASFPQARARAEGHHQSGIIGQVVWAAWSRTPVQSFISVETDSGGFITTLETDADGLFRLALKPGTYVLTPFWPQPPPVTLTGPPIRVIVEKKDYSIVEMPFSFGPE